MQPNPRVKNKKMRGFIVQKCSRHLIKLIIIIIMIIIKMIIMIIVTIILISAQFLIVVKIKKLQREFLFDRIIIVDVTVLEKEDDLITYVLLYKNENLKKFHQSSGKVFS